MLSFLLPMSKSSHCILNASTGLAAVSFSVLNNADIA